MENETKKLELTKEEIFLLAYALSCLEEEYKKDLNFSLKIECNEDNIRYWKKCIAEINALKPKII